MSSAISGTVSLTVQLPADLYRRLSEIADADGLTVQDVVIEKLRESTNLPHQGRYRPGLSSK